MGKSSLDLLFLLLSCMLGGFRLNTDQIQMCINTANFTINSAYGENRKEILSSLASSFKDNGGFYIYWPHWGRLWKGLCSRTLQEWPSWWRLFQLCQFLKSSYHWEMSLPERSHRFWPPIFVHCPVLRQVLFEDYRLKSSSVNLQFKQNHQQHRWVWSGLI